MLQAPTSASIIAGAALLCTNPVHAASASTIVANAIPQNAARLRNVVGTTNCAPWAEKQFAKLSELMDRWHEFDADPIQPKTIKQLRALMSEARNPGEHTGFIVPGADGSLQAEWHTKDADIGILVEDDGSYSTWVRSNAEEMQMEEFGFHSVDFLRSLAVLHRLNV